MRALKYPPILSLLVLLLPGTHCQDCREVFTGGQGVFVSENFPHALPQNSYCVYEFLVRANIRDTDVLCFWFTELELFTVKNRSHIETQIFIGGTNQFEAFLIYAGNGTLFLTSNTADRFVYKRPDSLLNGPVCLRLITGLNRHIIAVSNNVLLDNRLNRTSRFVAKYEALHSRWLVNQESVNRNSSDADLHLCLDGTHVTKSLRCNRRNDCGQPLVGDFLDGVSSDESYEHAGCSSVQSFGTNFARGQASAQISNSWAAQVDCSIDHSRHFLVSQLKDCSLRLNADKSPSIPIYHWLMGVRPAAKPQSAVCYRFFATSNRFENGDEAIALTEPDGGRVLLRLPAREIWLTGSWSFYELQLPAGYLKSTIDVFTIPSEQRNRTLGRHWLDDLSAEPAACDQSDYESRMPATCSFEWSTCGWDAIDLPIVTDASVSNELGVAVSDHTRSSVPVRNSPPLPQRVLRLQPGTNGEGRLMSRRRLPFGNTWCFEIWFNAVGYSGYSTQIEARISGVNLTESLLLTATAPNNKWHRLSATLRTGISKSPVMGIKLISNKSNQFTVLLDDLSVHKGYCSPAKNGTVQCGTLEWSCRDGKQCVPSSSRCDGRFQCRDKSDEVNCNETYGASSEYWSTVLRVVIGLTVCIVGALILSVCLHKRRIWLARRVQSRDNPRSARPRTVTDGRLPPSLRSDRFTRRRPDMPPSYDEVAAGAINTGFSADEEPPKYEDVAQVFQIQIAQLPEEQQEQQQQQQQQLPALSENDSSQ